MFKFGITKMKLVKNTWSDIEDAADNIIIQMYADMWRPDYIVGITRGGLILATILSHKLSIRMETLKVKLTNAADNENNESNTWMSEDAFGYNLPTSGITGARWDIKQRKNILIVDDFSDTGATFNWIKKDWQSSCFPNNPSWDTVWHRNVKFAVMTEYLSSAYDNVDYSYQLVDNSLTHTQYTYPYEYKGTK